MNLPAPTAIFYIYAGLTQLCNTMNNNNNWFSCLDGSNPYNGFIHTKDWEYYINSNSAFPIAYEVVALIIQKHIFKEFYV